MKPQLLTSDWYDTERQKQIMTWLKSNGCPYMIPREARIIVTGNYVLVPCWQFRTPRQSRTLLPRRIPRTGFRVKVRKYRIRHELRIKTPVFYIGQRVSLFMGQGGTGRVEDTPTGNGKDYVVSFDDGSVRLCNEKTITEAQD